MQPPSEAHPTVVVALRSPMREAALEMLRRLGLRAEEASSGLGALTAVTRLVPPAVVLDIALTGTLGLRLVPALREPVPELLCLVAVPFPSLAQAVENAGAVPFLATDLRPLQQALRMLVVNPSRQAT